MYRTEWMLALRAITQKPFSYFVEHKGDFESHRPGYGTEDNVPKDFVFDSSSYKTIFNQVGSFVLTGALSSAATWLSAI